MRVEPAVRDFEAQRAALVHDKEKHTQSLIVGKGRCDHGEFSWKAWWLFPVETRLCRLCQCIDAHPSYNYRLQSTSPVIDKGMTLSLAPIDADSIARPQLLAYDIGAYEYH
jgi:hypothetical protein